MKNLTELNKLIIDWSIEKGIDNIENQKLKLSEEVGEVSKEIISGNKQKQKEEIGDVYITSIILAHISDYKHFAFNTENYFDVNTDFLAVDKNNSSLISKIIYYGMGAYTIASLDYLSALCLNLGHNLTECVNIAFEKIKDRKGQTLNGSFVKDADLKK